MSCSIAKAKTCNYNDTMKSSVPNKNFGNSSSSVPKIFFASFSSMIATLEIRSYQLNTINNSSTFDFDLPNLIRHLAKLGASSSSKLFSPIASKCHLIEHSICLLILMNI